MKFGILSLVALLLFCIPQAAEAKNYTRKDCREFTRIYTDKEKNKKQVSYGTACRDAKGIWNVVSEQRYPKSSGIYTNVILEGDSSFTKVFYPVSQRRYDNLPYNNGAFTYYNRNFRQGAEDRQWFNKTFDRYDRHYGNHYNYTYRRRD